MADPAVRKRISEQTIAGKCRASATDPTIREVVILRRAWNAARVEARTKFIGEVLALAASAQLNEGAGNG
jgi:hypothetical protein